MMMGFGRSLALSLVLLASQQPEPTEIPVDLELVLAADASGSMDVEERRLQVEGYAQAFRDPKVIAGICGGRTGRIAVTYVEWSDEQQAIVPWTLIDSAASAETFAAAVARAPIYQHYGGTNITGALQFGAASMRSNAFNGMRLIIDISGDGENNSWYPPDPVRDALVKQGITINGLPLNILDEKRKNRRKQVADAYYAAHVIGGEGSFLLLADKMSDFKKTIRLKLLREIASR
jgi:Mg-chelatase subunit ChlD